MYIGTLGPETCRTAQQCRTPQIGSTAVYVLLSSVTKKGTSVEQQAVKVGHTSEAPKLLSSICIVVSATFSFFIL